MRAGALSSRVTIEQLVTGQDVIGQPVATWTTLATVWAHILHRSGSEAIKAGADVSIVQASIRIRRRTDITAAMRVVHGATIYQIQSVLPDEQDRERLDLVCQVVA